jgi:hypothetical protein
MPNTNDSVGTDEVETPLNRLPTPDSQELETAREEKASQYRELQIDQAAPPVRMKLEPPIDYDGVSYKEVICDFDGMTGKDFQRCEREFTRLYKADRNETPLPEMKHEYHVSIIVRASEIAGKPVPRGLIVKLPRRYYTPLRLEAVKACGSSLEEESR